MTKVAKAVVFIPGIGGSSLYLKGQYPGGHRTCWTLSFLLGAVSQEHDEQLRKIDTEFDAILLHDNDIAIFGAPGYDKLKRYFLGKDGWSWGGDPLNHPFVESIENVFFEFPYDWRQDVILSARALSVFMKDRVEALFLEAPEVVPEIYLITHSTGGLIARAYLSNNYRADQYDDDCGELDPHVAIKKQVLIAVPNHGAPKAYRVLKTGGGFSGPHGIPSHIPGPDRMRRLCHDWPCVYQLLPSQQYDRYMSNDWNGPIAEIPPGSIGPSIDSDRMDDNSGTPIFDDRLTVKETYVKDLARLRVHQHPEPIDQDALPRERDIVEQYCLDNDELVRRALKLHNELGRKTFLDPGDTYVIYSDKVETVSSMRWNSTKGKLEVHFKSNGDQTVPAVSAYDLEGIWDGQTGTHPRKEFVISRNHGIDGFDPKEQHLIRKDGIYHTELPVDPQVLQILDAIVVEDNMRR